MSSDATPIVEPHTTDSLTLAQRPLMTESCDSTRNLRDPPSPYCLLPIAGTTSTLELARPNPHPFSPFYQHGSSRTSLQDPELGGWPLDSKQPHCNTRSMTSLTLNGDGTSTKAPSIADSKHLMNTRTDPVWPTKLELAERARLRKRLCKENNAMARQWHKMNDGQKLCAKILLCLVVVAVAVGLGVGISLAVHGGVYSPKGQINAVSDPARR